MKLKNIEVGDLVVNKIDFIIPKLPSISSGNIWTVISKESKDYKEDLNVLVELKGIEKWCNHKDLRKYKPQLKTLDYSIFESLDKKWGWVAVDSSGKAHKFTKFVEPESTFSIFKFSYDGSKDFEYELIGDGYDASDWQNSLISRERLFPAGSNLK